MRYCQSIQFIKYLRPEEDDEYYHMSYDGKKTRWDNTTYPHCCSSNVDWILTIYSQNSQNQTLATFLEDGVKFPVNILAKICTLHRGNMFKTIRLSRHFLSVHVWRPFINKNHFRICVSGSARASTRATYCGTT